MNPLDVVRLSPLMSRSRGLPQVVVAIIDGPVAQDHPDFSGSAIRAISPRSGAWCLQPKSVACAHGTFVAGILVARRESPAPAICPDCTLLVHPIFTDSKPTASPHDVASAINDAVRAGANVVNLSAAILQHSSSG